jgi:hypothetical protein
MKEVHITLVHGTFARRLSWLRLSSVLKQDLQSKLSTRVIFHRFSWSGWPLHKSRYRAARRLHKFLDERISGNPAHTHFVIAHSHGGNLVLYALRDTRVAAEIAGVVTLSTPFLVPRTRTVNRPAGWILFGLMIAVAASGAGAFFLFGLLPLHFWLTGQPKSEVLWLPPDTGLLLFYIALAVGGLLYYLFVTLPRSFAARLARELTLAELRSDQLLIVRGPADEANALLLTVQALATLASSFWSAEKQRRRSVKSLLLERAEKELENENTPLWRQVLWFVAFIVAAAVLGMLGLTFGALFLAGIAIGSILMLFVVPELILVATFLTVSIEPSPPGLYTYVQIRGGRRSNLWHSITYADAEALRAIAEWIAATVRKHSS